jgi:uncharacterized protein YycO
MIAAYRGISMTSKLIRWFNRSDYSHVSYVSHDYIEIEAWQGHGVRRNNDIRTNDHMPGTQVELYDVEGITNAQEEMVQNFVRSKIRKSYDMRGVLQFVSRRRETAAQQDKWFCSELVFAAYRAAGVHLLERIEPYKVYPGMVVVSPRLRYLETIIIREHMA